MRTGVLGGTFDPPHRGHLALAAAAHEQLSLDEVLFVPAGTPYRKAARDVTPAAVRLRLVEAAVVALPWARVSTIEVERPGPTYTDETMRALATSGGDWWFIVGADVLEDLQHWRNPPGILEVARLAVAARGHAQRRVPQETADAVPGIGERIDWLDMPLVPISSTELRRRLATGDDTGDWLTSEVRALIDELGLYRPEARR